MTIRAINPTTGEMINASTEMAPPEVVHNISLDDADIEVSVRTCVASRLINSGPLARHDLRDDLHQQVQASIAKGAHCLLGGTIPEGPGAFYPPTVLTHVRKGMLAYGKEFVNIKTVYVQ